MRRRSSLESPAVRSDRVEEGAEVPLASASVRRTGDVQQFPPLAEFDFSHGLLGRHTHAEERRHQGLAAGARATSSSRSSSRASSCPRRPDRRPDRLAYLPCPASFCALNDLVDSSSCASCLQTDVNVGPPRVPAVVLVAPSSLESRATRLGTDGVIVGLRAGRPQAAWLLPTPATRATPTPVGPPPRRRAARPARRRARLWRRRRSGERRPTRAAPSTRVGAASRPGPRPRRLRRGRRPSSARRTSPRRARASAWPGARRPGSRGQRA